MTAHRVLALRLVTTPVVLTLVGLLCVSTGPLPVARAWAPVDTPVPTAREVADRTREGATYREDGVLQGTLAALDLRMGVVADQEIPNSVLEGGRVVEVIKCSLRCGKVGYTCLYDKCVLLAPGGYAAVIRQMECRSPDGSGYTVDLAKVPAQSSSDEARAYQAVGHGDPGFLARGEPFCYLGLLYHDDVWGYGQYPPEAAVAGASVEWQDLDGLRCLRLEYQLPSAAVVGSVTAWVAPDRGYRMVREERIYRRPDADTRTLSIRAVEGFRRLGAGLWLPTRQTWTYYTQPMDGGEPWRLDAGTLTVSDNMSLIPAEQAVFLPLFPNMTRITGPQGDVDLGDNTYDLEQQFRNGTAPLDAVPNVLGRHGGPQ
jgi:hypothetical protein